MEPIEVTARFNHDGKIDPIRFTWSGHDYPVESVGRRWRDEQGEHLLIMVPGDTIYELLFVPTEVRWFIHPVGPHHMWV